MRSLFSRYSIHKNQQAFALPTIILLTLIMSFVAYAALIQSNNNLNLAYKQAYIQIARTASKSAIDYAQEQFDNSACGEFDGFDEQEIISNDRYRVTMRAEVLETSADGYEKTIQGTGSVYLPRTSADAKYVFDIRSEVVRTYALCKSPDAFNPTLWLDASDTTTLKKGTNGTTTATYETDYGGIFDSTRDTLKERVNDGTQPLLAWYSPALDMHTCNGSEFIGALLCFFTSTRYLYAGTVFEDVNIPQGSTISSATLQFTGCNASSGCSSGNVGGSVTHRTYGIYQTATDPHKTLFTSSGVGQLRNRLTNASLRTAAYNDTTTNNFPPGNTTNFNVTNIVQEMVNNANWSPGNMGFGIQRQNGSGSRRAAKDGVRLSITYTTSGVIEQADNGDFVQEWHDKSGQANHAIFAHGTAPLRVDNQIDTKPIVRFNGGTMLSSLNTPLANKREMTVMGVIKPDFSGSSSDARVISGMTSSQTNDTPGSTSIVPLLRYGTSAGFSSVYSTFNPAFRTDYLCGATCTNQPFVVASVFRSQDAIQTEAQLKGNGQNGSEKNDISPATSSPPYTYGINQLYIGGNRTGAMPGSGQNYMHGDFAELVVYDRALTCREIEALEEYFRDKWNVYAEPAATTCPATTIPTL